MFCSKTINSTGFTLVNTFQRIYNIKDLISIDSFSMELSVVVTVLCSMLLALSNKDW